MNEGTFQWISLLFLRDSMLSYSLNEIISIFPKRNETNWKLLQQHHEHEHEQCASKIIIKKIAFWLQAKTVFRH